MNKQEQARINDQIVDMVHLVNEEIEDARAISVNKLRTCSAQVIEYANYYVLQSYRTIVAMIDKADGTCYDFLRYVYGYTSTSAQHINKFKHDYHAEKCLTYR